MTNEATAQLLDTINVLHHSALQAQHGAFRLVLEKLEVIESRQAEIIKRLDQDHIHGAQSE